MLCIDLYLILWTKDKDTIIYWVGNTSISTHKVGAKICKNITDSLKLDMKS